MLLPRQGGRGITTKRLGERETPVDALFAVGSSVMCDGEANWKTRVDETELIAETDLLTQIRTKVNINSSDMFFSTCFKDWMKWQTNREITF